MFYKGGAKVNELQGANEGKLREHIAELAKWSMWFRNEYKNEFNTLK